jgi:hypothetical protein
MPIPNARKDIIPQAADVQVQPIIDELARS